MTASLWKAAAAKADITPRQPIRLAGYDFRSTPSTNLVQEIYARVLVLEDEAGRWFVLLSTDLLGFSAAMTNELRQRIAERYGVPRERLVLNASHNHSGPATGDLLHLYFDLQEGEQEVIDYYTAWLLDTIVELVGQALPALEPAQLEFGQGVAGFGTNRRRASAGLRHRPGPVDHDVPVLTVKKSDEELLATVFGYACHTTAARRDEIHGDYAGFAQTELEAQYPGMVALFITGCGGDINPLPRSRPDAAQIYGTILASAVQEVLGTEKQPLTAPLCVGFARVQLPFQIPFTREQIVEQIPLCEGLRYRELEFALSILDRDGEFPASAPFDIQVWQFGSELTWIFLSGEPVVDYSLAFKARYGWENTWVSGYCNELLSYIPSLRVLREGGYEGTEGMMEYGLPAPYTSAVEQIIIDAVHGLVENEMFEDADAVERVCNLIG